MEQSQFDPIERQRLEPDSPCFIIIRFRATLVQAAKNSLSKWLSVHSNYTGSVSGISSGCVQCVEGCWDEQKGVAMLYFDRVDVALRWHDSVPEIRQQDWLGGVDMIIVPVSDMCPPDPRRSVIQLMELQFHDYHQYERDYSQGAKEILERHGAGQVISSAKLKKLKGQWDPEYLVMNGWETVDCFDKAYYGEDNKKMMERRRGCAQVNSCIFQLEPLIKPRCTKR